MKFMKLGSKPDLFQTEGDNIRSVSDPLFLNLGSFGDMLINHF